MSVNYTSTLVYGLRVNMKDCEVELSPAEYVMEDRFDTKTGNVTHQEKVLKKARCTHYKIGGFFDEGFYELYEQLYKVLRPYALSLVSGQDSGYFVIGECQLNQEDCGKVEWTEEGCIKLAELEIAHEMVGSSLDKLGIPFEDSDLGLHVVTSIG